MLEAGERLSDELEQHLKHFGMIARYSRMKAESVMTKRLLMASLSETLRKTEVQGEDHKLKTFKEMIQLALDNKEIFNRAAKNKPKVGNEPHVLAAVQEESEEEDRRTVEEIAAVAPYAPPAKSLRREERKREKKERIYCEYCGKNGHTKDNCWTKQRA